MSDHSNEIARLEATLIASLKECITKMKEPAEEHEAQREMTLWEVVGALPEDHRARKEFFALKGEQLKDEEDEPQSEESRIDDLARHLGNRVSRLETELQENVQPRLVQLQTQRGVMLNSQLTLLNRLSALEKHNKENS